MLSFVMLVIGFVLLVWGADKFVEGASALARKMGVSPLLVGLTIVAFGTSMPELAVSVTAALRGANEIAVGNVVGSNMFNLLVVAGLSAVICPLVMDKMLLRRDWPLSIFAAVLLLVAIAPDHVIARWEGAVLLVIFAVILSRQIKAALNDRAQLAAAEAEAAEEAAEMTKSPVMIWVNIVLGLACIVLGGQLAVNGATGIARMFGLSETLIGLTIVAIGTSLPELVTSIVAARKGQNEIARSLFNAVKDYVNFVRGMQLVEECDDATTQAPVEPAPVVSEPAPQPAKAAAAKKPSSGYTIQILASTKRLKSNDWQFKSYKNKVIELRSAGRYRYKYCVGRYATQAEAKRALSQVKKSFGDAYIVRYEGDAIAR